MEIAKFILTALGTFLSVFALIFSMFQHWRKKQEDKLESINSSLSKKIQSEIENRKETETRLRDRIDKIDEYVTQEFEPGRIEGKLDGIAEIVSKMQDWFISNPQRR